MTDQVVEVAEGTPWGALIFVAPVLSHPLLSLPFFRTRFCRTRVLTLMAPRLPGRTGGENLVGSEARAAARTRTKAPALQHLRPRHSHPEGMERRRRGPPPLLVQASGGHASGFGPVSVRGRACGDLGDLVVVLLAGTLAGLRDRLASEGFEGAADLVAELVEATDAYLAEIEVVVTPPS